MNNNHLKVVKTNDLWKVNSLQENEYVSDDYATGYNLHPRN